MNKILQLLDDDFVKSYLTKKVLPMYPDLKSIESIKIIPHKKMIWETTYHAVFEFETTFVDKNDQRNIIPIFCTAHSNEPRKNVFTSLKYLWDKGFSSGDLSIPHPLFYSAYFQATFYRGVEGKNLYYYIKKNDREELEIMIPKAAALFAKLHGIKNDGTRNFNRGYSRIKTVNPGAAHILERIKNEHNDYYEFYKTAYDVFIKKESKFFNSTESRWLVHGDAHPENIIRMSERKIALIDFTDLSLADYARDLGSFSQQLEYMIGRKIGNRDYAQAMSKLFLDSYFSVSKNTRLDDEVKQRIDMYYNWTAIRTTTHFLLKLNTEISRAEELIIQVSKNMNIKY